MSPVDLCNGLTCLPWPVLSNIFPSHHPLRDVKYLVWRSQMFHHSAYVCFSCQSWYIWKWNFRVQFSGSLHRDGEPTVSLWGCSLLLGAHFRRISGVWQRSDIMSERLDFNPSLTRSLVVNFLTFFDTCLLQSNKILPLSGANVNIIFAVVSSLRQKSMKLASNKWKLCRYLVCWKLFLQKLLNALNSTSDQYKK